MINECIRTSRDNTYLNIPHVQEKLLSTSPTPRVKQSFCRFAHVAQVKHQAPQHQPQSSRGYMPLQLATTGVDHIRYGCTTIPDVNTKGGKPVAVLLFCTRFTNEAASIAASTTIVAAAGMPSGHVTHCSLRRQQQGRSRPLTVLHVVGKDKDRHLCHQFLQCHQFGRRRQ